MSDILLSIKGLSTHFNTQDGIVRAVDDVSFDIHRGETFALLGESGCGKSMTSLSIMRLVPEPAGQIVAGEILLDGQDLMSLSESGMRRIRGSRIAMIFQEPMTSLNPVMSIGEQIAETVRQHRRLNGSGAKNVVLELLDAVGIPDPRQRYDEYPHQLSGGMKQRVMIAIALAGEPDLLIADEPTTALDVTIQAQVLALLGDLQKKTGMAVLLITHDLGVVSGMADTVAVMYAGQIIELGEKEAFYKSPQHPYSQKLFDSLPDVNKRDQQLAIIHGAVPSLARTFKGCRFAERCDFAWDLCHETEPQWTTSSTTQRVRCHLLDPSYAAIARTKSLPSEPMPPPGSISPGRGTGASEGAQDHSQGVESGPLLEVEEIKVHFPVRKGLFKRTVGHVYAVDGVTLNIGKGTTVALVGESGCGKTTIGKAILQLIRPTAGNVRFEGEELTQLRGEALRRRRSDFQIIFQDPFSSMNPRMMVNEIIEEGMIALGIEKDARRRESRVDALLAHVGLPKEVKNRYPHEFSGGQRQRICIARTLAVEPKLIICDEPTSALDISVQAQILNLLKRLQNELGLSYLFITHNLSVVGYLADEVAVMYLGRIVEYGLVQEVLAQPKHPYTQALLSAIPVIDQQTNREIIRLEGDLPSPSNPPAGCHFHTRCPHVMPVCKTQYPARTPISETHSTHCFLYDDQHNSSENGISSMG